MLSKFYECTSRNFTKADTNFVSALIREIEKLDEVKDITVLYPGGTLGLFFKCEMNDQSLFLKTHHPNTLAHDNLIKELNIMRALYKDLFNVNDFSVCIDGNENRIMAMDYWDIHNEMHNPEYIASMVDDYSNRLCGCNLKVNFSMDDFIEAVIYSKDCLLREKFIDHDTGKRLENSLKNYKGYSECSQTVCHGDLSDANIVEINRHPVALDWEDALINVKEYDLLYWLTFFAQRRLYSSSLFSDIGINETYGKDIMIMVVAVKSFLSVAKGSYKYNTLSIQDRMNEIIRM